MEKEKKIRTIRWDGTCKKCGVKSYFAPVNVTSKGRCWKQMMCIICYWGIRDQNEKEKAKV